MIHLKKISKSFDDKEVLKDITFDIKKGDIIGLVGKNGAGKTTLLTILVGLIDASSGQLYYNDLFLKDANIKIGYLPDVPEFFDYLTINEYINFLSQSLMKSNEIDKLLKSVGLHKNVKIKTLSRGMRQRLGMAAVLVNDPDVIILDEPNSALDPEGRIEMASLLSLMKKEGKTIVLSTHILNDIEKICDTVVFLKDGCVSKIIDVNYFNKQCLIKLTFESPLNSTDIFNGSKAVIIKSSNVS